MITSRKGLLGIFLVACGCAAALASYDGTIYSVHFYDGVGDSGPIDFGQVPQQMMTIGWNDLPKRGGTDAQSDFLADYGADHPLPVQDVDWIGALDDQSSKDFVAKRDHARNAEVEGHLGEAVKAYAYAELEHPGHQTFLAHRKQLALVADGVHDPALALYLRATYVQAFWNQSGAAELAELAKLPIPAYLRPFVVDLQADKDVDDAYRAARSDLAGDNGAHPHAADATAKLLKLLWDHPNTVRRRAILGWIARGEYLQGRYDLALSLYRKQLAVDVLPLDRWETHRSMVFVLQAKHAYGAAAEILLGEWLRCPDGARHVETHRMLRSVALQLTTEQARHLQRTVRRDPLLLAAYLGFRIEDTSLTPKQEAALYRFAETSLERLLHPPALLLVRVAQASYNAGLYGTAKRLGLRALGAPGISREQHQRAHYIVAGSLARLGRPLAAIRIYRKLLTEGPRQYLADSSREHLALLEERYGDPALAPEQYRKLGYDWDYAYLADIKLTPAQLERAAARTPAGDDRNVLLYTLGMRYLRKRQYTEARAVWMRLDPATRLHFGLSKLRFERFQRAWANEAGMPPSFASGDASDPITRVGVGSGFEDFPNNPDPLETTNTLARLQRIARQGSQDVRANALYQMAAYTYSHRDLLLYSPALWKGDRVWALSDNWSSTNDHADEVATKRHLMEHECYAQTYTLCREIVERYPKAKILPKALYTGAMSAVHLVRMNAIWRRRDAVANLKVAVAFMNELSRRFPTDPLAHDARKYAGEFQEEMRSDRWYR